MRRRTALIGLALALWLSVGVVAYPQEGAASGVDRRALIGDPQGRPLGGEELAAAAKQLAGKMRCPVCQGLSVADSPTLSAQAMYGEVEEFLAQGYTREQILTYFEQSYGEFILLEPKAEGFNLLVWIAPALALLAGLLLIRRLGRLGRSGRGNSARGASVADEDDELESYRQRVRREIAS